MITTSQIGTGVDINRRHRLSLLNHKVSTGFQLHPVTQRPIDFIFNTVKIENWSLTAVAFQSGIQFRHKILQKLNHLIEFFLIINPNLLNFRPDQISDRPHVQGNLAIYRLDAVHALNALFDFAPQPF